MEIQIFRRACCFSAFPTDSDQYGPIFYWNWFVALRCTTLSATNVRVCDFAIFQVNSFKILRDAKNRSIHFKILIVIRSLGHTQCHTHTHSMLDCRSLRTMSYFFHIIFSVFCFVFVLDGFHKRFVVAIFSIGIRHSLSIKQPNVRKRFFIPNAASHWFVWCVSVQHTCVKWRPNRTRHPEEDRKKKQKSIPFIQVSSIKTNIEPQARIAFFSLQMQETWPMEYVRLSHSSETIDGTTFWNKSNDIFAIISMRCAHTLTRWNVESDGDYQQVATDFVMRIYIFAGHIIEQNREKSITETTKSDEGEGIVVVVRTLTSWHRTTNYKSMSTTMDALIQYVRELGSPLLRDSRNVNIHFSFCADGWMAYGKCNRVSTIGTRHSLPPRQKKY